MNRPGTSNPNRGGTHVSPPLIFLSLLAVLSLCGCPSPPPPSEVYIPGPGFSVQVSISASSTKVAVGEPIILKAKRSSSGFISVPLSDVPEGVQWWRSLPPALEEEVAGNLRWFVEPAGSATFNTDFRADMTREVRFSEPGTYILFAASSGYGSGSVESNRVRVTVRSGDQDLGSGIWTLDPRL